MFKLLYFFGLMRSQWVLIFLGFVLSLITVLASIGLLSLSGYLICGAAFSGVTLIRAWTFNYMLPSAGIRFFALIRIASRYGDRLFSHNATFRILSSLRLWLYQKIEPLAPALFLKYRSSDVLNRFVNDIDALDHLYLRVLSPLLCAVFVTVAMWFLLKNFDVRIAENTVLVMLATMLLLPLILVKFSKNAGKDIIKGTARLRGLWIDAQQTMANLLLFNARSRQLDQVSHAQKDLILSQKKIAQCSGLGVAMVGVALSVSIFLALYFGIPLINHHHFNGAYFGFIILAIMAAYEAIVPLPIAFQYLGKTEQAATRLLDIAREKPAIVFVEKPTAPENYDIEIRRVSFRYQNQVIDSLRNIQLNISHGDKVVIQGPTGSGKTTLIHLLTRFWDPTNGEIFLGGVDLRHISEADLRTSISLVEQSPHIFNATVKENLCIANPQADESQLWSVLELVGLSEIVVRQDKKLDSMMGEFGRLFSGGQIRRFAIARAILHDAPIIILDEPTEGLDFESANVMMQNMMSLWNDKTVIIISHQDVVLPYSDRVIQLRDGLSQEGSIAR